MQGNWRKYLDEGVNDNGTPYTNWDDKAVHNCETCGMEYRILHEYRTMEPTPTHWEGGTECLEIQRLKKELGEKNA